MGLGCKTLLIAVALVCAAAPALASSGADASFIAVDYAWQANGVRNATTLTIAPGQTVTFSYPEGGDIHNLHFNQGRRRALACRSGRARLRGRTTAGSTRQGPIGSCARSTRR